MRRRRSSRAWRRCSKRKASPTTSTLLPRRAARPAHLVRGDGGDARRRGADAVARLGLRAEPRPRCPRRRDRAPGCSCTLATAAILRRRSSNSNDTMAPKVLISDALSPAAVQIFKDRGIEVDFQPKLGKDKEKLAEMIGNYDGLAIRSATKVTAKILEKAKNLKVIGRAGIGVDNVDIPAATAQGHHRDEHAVRQFDHDRRACHLPDAGAGAADSGGRRLDPGRQMGKEQLHGRRDFRQDARRHRLRQYRLDRRRPRASACA